MATGSRYELYKDNAGQWRWRYVAKNGKTIAISSEGYVNKSDCSHSIELVKDSKSDPVVEE